MLAAWARLEPSHFQALSVMLRWDICIAHKLSADCRTFGIQALQFLSVSVSVQTKRKFDCSIFAMGTWLGMKRSQFLQPDTSCNCECHLQSSKRNCANAHLLPVS